MLLKLYKAIQKYIFVEMVILFVSIISPQAMQNGDPRKNGEIGPGEKRRREYKENRKKQEAERKKIENELQKLRASSTSRDRCTEAEEEVDPNLIYQFAVQCLKGHPSEDDLEEFPRAFLFLESCSVQRGKFQEELEKWVRELFHMGEREKKLLQIIRLDVLANAFVQAMEKPGKNHYNTLLERMFIFIVQNRPNILGEPRLKNFFLPQLGEKSYRFLYKFEALYRGSVPLCLTRSVTIEGEGCVDYYMKLTSVGEYCIDGALLQPKYSKDSAHYALFQPACDGPSLNAPQPQFPSIYLKFLTLIAQTSPQEVKVKVSPETNLDFLSIWPASGPHINFVLGAKFWQGGQRQAVVPQEFFFPVVAFLKRSRAGGAVPKGEVDCAPQQVAFSLQDFNPRKVKIAQVDFVQVLRDFLTGKNISEDQFQIDGLKLKRKKREKEKESAQEVT